MKHLITIILLLIIPYTSAQQVKTINLNTKNITSLSFPTNIIKIKGGFTPDKFALEQFNNIYYIQPLIEFERTNLTVITEDNLIYILNLNYCNKVDSLLFFHEFTQTDAVNYNQMYTPQPSNQPLPTLSSAIIPASKTETKEFVGNIKIETDNPLMQRIAQTKGFISFDNGIRKNGLEVFLKGIYVNKDDMFFQIEINNTSFVKFDYNFFGFAIEITKKSKTQNYERIDITPLSLYLPEQHLAKKTIQIIYRLPKITINAEKHLLIEIFEGGHHGERNISFPISSETLLSAKPI